MLKQVKPVRKWLGGMVWAWRQPENAMGAFSLNLTAHLKLRFQAA
ncbi:hypothetical protein [Kingella bonacorsii]|nr:hypothetical protein [Kingella bonacorsii]